MSEEPTPLELLEADRDEKLVVLRSFTSPTVNLAGNLRSLETQVAADKAWLMAALRAGHVSPVAYGNEAGKDRLARRLAWQAIEEEVVRAPISHVDDWTAELADETSAWDDGAQSTAAVAAAEVDGVEDALEVEVVATETDGLTFDELTDGATYRLTIDVYLADNSKPLTISVGDDELAEVDAEEVWVRVDVVFTAGATTLTLARDGEAAAVSTFYIAPGLRLTQLSAVAAEVDTYIVAEGVYVRAANAVTDHVPEEE